VIDCCQLWLNMMILLKHTINVIHRWHYSLDSVDYSPQVNYTDWANANGRRILVPTFVDRRLSRGQRGGKPTAVNVSFIDWSYYFFFRVAPHLSSRVWSDPFPDSLLGRKSGSAGNRTRDLWVCSQELWTLDHRGGPKQKGYFIGLEELEKRDCGIFQGIILEL
jgi:hypothetical protein